MGFLFWIVLLATFDAQAASFFEELLSQTVAQPMFVEQKDYTVTPAFGYGTYSNSLSAQEKEYLSHTNSSFYILGLDINRFSSHFFIPYKDSADRVQKSVDSDVFRIQSSFKVTPNLTVEGSFAKVIGYYIGNPEDPKAIVSKFSDLGIKKYSFVGTYMMDANHISSLFSPIAYRAVETGKSLFFGFELAHHDLMGLYHLNGLLPVADQKATPVKAAKDVSVLGSVGWSQSRMYQNFFWSYAIGIGFGGSVIEKQYQDTKSTDALISTTVPFSGAFGWNKGSLTTGVFAAVRSWTAKVDNLSLSSSNGNSGLYLAYQF